MYRNAKSQWKIPLSSNDASIIQISVYKCSFVLKNISASVDDVLSYFSICRDLITVSILIRWCLLSQQILIISLWQMWWAWAISQHNIFRNRHMNGHSNECISYAITMVNKIYACIIWCDFHRNQITTTTTKKANEIHLRILMPSYLLICTGNSSRAFFACSKKKTNACIFSSWISLFLIEMERKFVIFVFFFLLLFVMNCVRFLFFFTKENLIYLMLSMISITIASWSNIYTYLYLSRYVNVTYDSMMAILVHGKQTVAWTVGFYSLVFSTMLRVGFW